MTNTPKHPELASPPVRRGNFSEWLQTIVDGALLAHSIRQTTVSSPTEVLNKLRSLTQGKKPRS